MFTFNELKTIFIANEVIKSFRENVEEYKRAHDIQAVDQKELTLDISSTLSYIVRVLANSKTPLTISTIIDTMEKIGWKSSSKYHKYSHVAQILRENNYMFIKKCSPATYRLRNGFLGNQSKQPVAINSKRDKSNQLISLRDIVSDMDYLSDKEGTYPSIIWNTLRNIGYRSAYSTIRRAMQDNPKIKRKGFFYHLTNSSTKKEN